MQLLEGKHNIADHIPPLIDIFSFTKLNDYTPNLPHFDYTTFPHLVRMFKRNLFKEYQEYWSKSLKKDKSDSSVGNKLSLYSEVKNEVRFESYLDLVKNVKTTVAVTKMRISCHLLPIESERTGRYPEFRGFAPFVIDQKLVMNSTIC